jgi:hypothetical protein
MTDMLTIGSTWLQGQRETFLSHQITYKRGSYTATPNATIGTWVFERETEQGLTTRIESRDFLITAANLILNNALIVPIKGDTIIETFAGKTNTYAVSAPAKEPVWKWADMTRLTYRIHTELKVQA